MKNKFFNILKIENKFLKKFIFYGFSTIFLKFLSFIIFPLHLSILDPIYFGKINEIYSYIAFFQVLYCFGIDSCIFRFSHLKNYINFAKTFTIFFSFILSFFLYIIFKSNIVFQNYICESNFILCLLILIFDSILVVFLSEVRDSCQDSFFVRVKLIQATIFFTLNILLYFFSKNVLNQDSIIKIIFTINLLSNFLASIYLILKKKISFFFSKRFLKISFFYSFPFFYSNLAFFLNDILIKMLFRFGSDDQNIDKSNFYNLGTFLACQKLSVFMNVIIQIYKITVEPFFLKKNFDKKNYEKNIFWFSIIGAFFVFFISSNVNILSFFLFKDKNYIKYTDCISIFLFSNLINGISYNFSLWMKVKNKIKPILFLSTVSVFSNLLFSSVLLKIIPHYASSFSILISNLINCFISLYIIKKNGFEIKFGFIFSFIFSIFFISLFFSKKNYQKIDLSFAQSLLQLSINTFISVIIFIIAIIYFISSEKYKKINLGIIFKKNIK